MKDFFNYIKARIESRITDMKVEPFNDQFVKADTDRTEKAIKYPICYIEFVVEDVRNMALGFKDYLLRVRFRLGFEGYKFVRIETWDRVDEFYRAIHMMRPTEASGLAFTSFQEIMPEFDEDHKNIEHPYIDYRTRLRSQVAYTRPTAIEGVELDIDVEFDLPVYLSEAHQQNPVYFYEDSELTPVFFREAHGTDIRGN